VERRAPPLPVERREPLLQVERRAPPLPVGRRDHLHQEGRVETTPNCSTLIQPVEKLKRPML
jgi:hypothetical protein